MRLYAVFSFWCLERDYEHGGFRLSTWACLLLLILVRVLTDGLLVCDFAHSPIILVRCVWALHEDGYLFTWSSLALFASSNLRNSAARRCMEMVCEAFYVATSSREIFDTTDYNFLCFRRSHDMFRICTSVRRLIADL
jgi:hypothetical protein